MKQTTRPPARYVVAPGSQFRLVPNEYDKNKYGQCNYASYRTLIRCKQICSKEELQKNGGRCHEHLEFSKVLENNHKREVMRCHAENDSKMQRRRFDPWIASNESISDEDDFLQAVQTVPQGIPDMVNHNILDEHPLRYAKHFTDKDIVKIKMSLVQKDIDDLLEFKRLVIAQAQKEHELLGSEGDDELPTDIAQRRVFKASKKYARKDYLTLTTIDPVYKRCCVGPEMGNDLVVAHVLHSLLDEIDGHTPAPLEKQCLKAALHLSKFCIDHITLDRRQKLFSFCDECGKTAIDTKTPKCSFHLKEQEKSKNVCVCSKCVPESSNEVDRGNTKNEHVNVVDEDEVVLGNLSRIESMVSPMQQFTSQPSHHSTSSNPTTSSVQNRRYHGPPAQLLRPPQMGPPPGSSHDRYQQLKPGQRLPPPIPGLTPQQVHEQNVLKHQEEELKSQTCARVRSIDPTQYGSGKKKQQQQRLQTRPPSSTGITPSNSYQLQQQKKMPSIISPTGFNSPPGGGKMTFQGWKNQAANSSQRSRHVGLGPARYPIYPNRNQPRPKNIPLERSQEPRNPDELIEDRSGSQSNYNPEPQRRGVPYYKTAYRRTELPTRHAAPQPGLTPSTSTSSSQLLAPPQSPHLSPKLYRPQQSRLPMAPHRAIAAGLNPADVGSPGLRPTFRMTPQGQRPYPSLQPPGGGPPHQQGQLNQNPNMPNQSGGPLRGVPMNQSMRPQLPTAPHRMMGLGAQRNTITTSYIVQGHGQSAPGLSETSGAGSSEPGTSDGTSGVRPSAVGPSGVTGPRGDFQEYEPLASFSAVSALDSARHDARFANINVRTFLSMKQNGQKDLSKMSQEEIEQMAAETESIQEKAPRKGVSQLVGGVAPGGAHSKPRVQTQGIVRGPGGSIRKSNASHSSIPNSVLEVVSTPSISTPTPGTRRLSSDSETKGSKKRKIGETSSTPSDSNTATSSEATASLADACESSGEPIAKKPTTSEESISAVSGETSEEPNGNPTQERSERSKTPKRTSSNKRASPRAAAVSANQAIVTQKPVTPSTSTASSSTSTAENEDNPLELLAELSAAAEAAEVEALGAPAPTAAAPSRGTSAANRKTPKKASSSKSAGSSSTTTPTSSTATTSTVSQRRSSTSRKASRGAEPDGREE